MGFETGGRDHAARAGPAGARQQPDAAVFRCLAYDIVSTVVYDTRNHRDNAPYWPDSELSMQIGTTRHYRDLRRADLIQAGQELGLSAAAAVFELDAMIAAVVHHAEQVRAEVEAEAGPDGGEHRLLKAILAMPVGEMSDRLRAPRGI